MSTDDLRARLGKPLEKVLNNVPSLSEAVIDQPSAKDPANVMTLMQYISNPTGKGTAYVANRAAIKAGLNMTYIKLLREHRKNFYAVPYMYGNKDILFY